MGAVDLNGFRTAVSLLTRVPVGADRPRPFALARAVPWFPVVGGLLGLAVAATYAGALTVLPPDVPLNRRGRRQASGLRRRLRELDFGDLEGMRWDDCSPVMQAELFSFDHFRAPGGESVDDLRRRVLDFARGLPWGEHLLFTHGGVIRMLLREAGRDGSVVPGALEQVVL